MSKANNSNVARPVDAASRSKTAKYDRDPKPFLVGGRDVHVIDQTDIADATRNNHVHVVKAPVQPPPPAVAAAPAGAAEPNKPILSYAQIAASSQPAAVVPVKTAPVAPLVEGISLYDQISSVPWPAGLPAEVQRHEAVLDPLPSEHSHTNKERTTAKRQRSLNPVDHVGESSSVRRSARVQQNAKLQLNYSDHRQPVYDNVPQPVAELVDSEPLIQLDCIPSAPHLVVDSAVAVSTDVTEDLVGIIRWIGKRDDGQPGADDNVMVGVELEDDLFDVPLNITSGKWRGRTLFRCPPARGLFVKAAQCTDDPRFMDSVADAAGGGLDLDSIECPIVTGEHAPMNFMSDGDLEQICGEMKGIQGHHNSCYLDATLFCMFAFTRVFDAVLNRTRTPKDHATYTDIQTVLRDEIVNPLRVNRFVRSDRVMNLRRLLEHMCALNTGLTSEEKDPEEFLKILLTDALNATPFLRLSSGQDAFCYQLFVERDERLQCPSVQQLFDQSFLSSDIKLREIPNCLIVQMPRFGKDYKLYDRILPSLLLDVTDVIDNSPRQCSTCGCLADLECKQCFDDPDKFSIEQITYCSKCSQVVHQKDEQMRSHRPRKIAVPDEYRDYMANKAERDIQRVYMELFAVVCIETSHYVSFAKTGSGEKAPWCFFDSMADRKGIRNGFNIPRLESVPELPDWLSTAGAQRLNEAAPSDRQLPMLARRLFCDAYLCMYQHRDMMMYR